MALTLQDLLELVTREGLEFFVHPSRPWISLAVPGMGRRHQLQIRLERDGTFLQIRTAHLLECPADHPHCDQLLRVIASANHRMQFLKLGWDPTDGEVTAFGDTWIGDGALTQGQFHAMLFHYLAGLYRQHPRLEHAIVAGEDSGPVTAEEVVRRVLGSDAARVAVSGTGSDERAGAGPNAMADTDEPMLTEL